MLSAAALPSGSPRRSASSLPRRHPWLVSLLLCLPVYLLYAANFYGQPPGVSGTGFVQYDQASYMADARAYFAGPHFSLTYGLPYSIDPNTPRVFFQPFTAMLGLALYATGINPGYLYMTAGIILAVVCGRIILRWYHEIVPEDDLASSLGLLCFFWGGGLLAVTGVLVALTAGTDIAAGGLMLDPGAGTFMLNLGRNLIYANEAFYHLLFLGTLLLLAWRRYYSALAGALLISASHPFYGIELVLVLGCFGILQIIGARDRITRHRLYWFCCGAAAIGGIHLYYYLVYLSRISPEYRAVRAQYALGWTVPWPSYVLSIALVAPFAWAGLADQWREHGRLTDRQQALLATFAVCLVLGHHDWFIKPMQPIHFLHGYDWAALFLLGAQKLVAAFRSLQNRPISGMWSVLIVAVFLSDNIFWFSVQLSPYEQAQHIGLTLTEAERAILSEFSEPRFRRCVVLSQDLNLGYLTVVYSPLRSYYSHWSNTPDAAAKAHQLKEFFASGRAPAVLADRCRLAVIRTGGSPRLAPLLGAGGSGPVSANDGLAVYARNLHQ
jgi:hypothetical protein